MPTTGPRQTSKLARNGPAPIAIKVHGVVAPLPDPFTPRQRVARRERAAAEAALRQFAATDPLKDAPAEWSPQEQAALDRLKLAKDELAAANAEAAERPY
jgi:hypothetical protein